MLVMLGQWEAYFSNESQIFCADQQSWRSRSPDEEFWKIFGMIILLFEVYVQYAYNYLSMTKTI